MPLLDLPQELLFHFLSFLGISDLASCQLTNRYLRAIIKASVHLQYLIAVQAAGVESNPNCNTSTTDRLELLRKREHAWAHFLPDFERLIPVLHTPSGIYDLAGGVYLLGARSRLSLRYCLLPCSPSAEATWKTLDIGRTVIDMALSVYEHDLIAVVTTTPIDPGFHVIDVLLFKFSTGERHPLAKNPSIVIPAIVVSEAGSNRPAVGIEIVGDNLAIVFTHYRHNPWSPDDYFCVYDWKTGDLKMDVQAETHTYAGLVFLSPDTVLLPNAQNATLEFWQIPASADSAPTKPIQSLSLPRLAADRLVTSISCRGEPNPGPPTHSPLPFHQSSSDSIIIFNLHISPIDFLRTSVFTFIVHRRGLLDLVSSALSSSVNDSESPPVPIPYAEWGPPVMCWFDSDAVPTRWITTTAGQRCVLISDSAARMDPGPVTVLDFNPYNVRRMAAHLRDHPSDRMWCVEKPESIEHNGAFDEAVGSGLPYAGCKSIQNYNYDGVLIDEERILGIRTDELDSIVSVEVLHFG